MKKIIDINAVVLGFLGTLFIMLLVTQSAKYEYITKCQQYTGNTYIACETMYEVK